MPINPVSANDETPLSVRDIFQEFLKNWLERASPALMQAARCAALPHSFDLALFNLLCGREVETVALMARLERTGLVIADGTGRYTFQPLLRADFLRRWQTEDRITYRQVSAQAAEFYYSRQFSTESDQLEYVYHQLGANDEFGVAAFTRLFEHLWALYRFGLVERLLDYADEQAPVLAIRSQAWLRYFQARLDLAQYRHVRSIETLQLLVAEEIDSHLRGHAQMSLANNWILTQQWSKALSIYTETQALFLRLGDHFNVARAFEAKGMAYVQLAANLGGLHEEEARPFAPRYQVWLHWLEHAPFLLYRWCSRRFAHLPNLYHGTDYQDWIIIRLLYAAIEQFEQAAGHLGQLSTTSDQPVAEVLADVQIRLAELYHRVGQWAIAERRFQYLAEATAVTASDYRTATLQVSQGRAHLARWQLDAARAALQAAHQVFKRDEDLRAQVTTARLLGDTEMAAHHFDTAVAFYLECIEAAVAIDDLLTVTHVCFVLAQMRDSVRLSPVTRSQIDELEQTLDRRAYIARFPGALLQRFRKLAIYVAMPLTYLVISLVAIELNLIVLVFEIVYQVTTTYIGPLLDIGKSLYLFSATLLLTLWTYEFFYVFAGWRFACRLPLDELAQHQPEYVVTLPDSLVVRDEDGQLTELPWDTIEHHIAIDRTLWRVPNALFSRLVLLADTTTIVIDGIISHYQKLQRDILSHVTRAKASATPNNLNFSFLFSWWMVVALLLTLLFVPIDLFDLLDRTCRETHISYAFDRQGSYAYVLDSEGNVRILDVWDPTHIVQVGFYDTPGQVQDIAVTSKYAYLAAGAAGLQIVDIAEPSHLSAVSSITITGEATGVAVAKNYAYIVSRNKGFHVIDVSDRRTPSEVGAITTLSEANDVAVADNFAYVALGREGLQVINVTDPTHPVAVGAYNTPGAALSIAKAGRYVYVADGDAGLRIVDVSDPTSPAEIGAYDTPGHALGIVKESSFVYVADGTKGLRVIHVWNPAKPAEVNAYATVGVASDVAVMLGYVYVADGRDGLRIINAVEPCDSVTEEGSYEGFEDITEVAMMPSYPLPVSTVLYLFFYWARFCFPIVGLARLLYNRAIVRRTLSVHFSLRTDGVLLLVFGLLVIMMLYLIWRRTL